MHQNRKHSAVNTREKIWNMCAPRTTERVTCHFFHFHFFFSSDFPHENRTRQRQRRKTCMWVNVRFIGIHSARSDDQCPRWRGKNKNNNKQSEFLWIRNPKIFHLKMSDSNQLILRLKKSFHTYRAPIEDHKSVRVFLYFFFSITTRVRVTACTHRFYTEHQRILVLYLFEIIIEISVDQFAENSLNLKDNVVFVAAPEIGQTLSTL